MLFPRAAQTLTAAQAWTDRAIHDTVAKIAAEPRFTHAPRESLLGRLFRYLWQRFLDLLAWFRGRGDARLYVYAAIALIVIVIVARVIAERQLAEGRRQRRTGSRGVGGVDDLWSVAKRAADDGRFAEACHDLYGAVLADLARGGAIRLHASKTGGDYARELQRRGFPRAGEFRAFVRTFDRAVFGAVDITAADYERVRDAAVVVSQQRAAA